ncbi:MAG: tetratricopeptide repeat protein [Planctomycetota bacterium]|nr:tetratricopeptide repeat protein [Planctomycetota bacterium]
METVAGTRWRLFAPLLLAAAVITVYSNSLNGTFLLDDIVTIEKNASIRQLWPPQRVWASEEMNSLAGRPVAAYTFAVSYALSETAPWGHRLLNILFHLLAVLALYGLLRRTFQLEFFAELAPHAAEGLALAAALVWAVHPLATASVTYVVQRVEVLMSLCYLATLYFAVRGFTATRSLPWFATAVLACALGMGCKEVMVSAPLAVCLYDRQFVSRSFKSALRNHAALYAGLALSWVLLYFLLSGNQRLEFVETRPKDESAATYFMAQWGILFEYLGLVVWPHPLIMLRWPPMDLDPAWTAVTGLGWSLLAGATLWGLWRRAAWSAPAAMFFMILAPSSSVIRLIEWSAERRMYLPSACVIALSVWLAAAGLRRLFQRLACRPDFRALAHGALLCAVTAGLGALTYARNEAYKSSRTLFEADLRNDPGNPKLLMRVGMCLCRAGRGDEGIAALRRALSIWPENVMARRNLALELAGRKQYEEAVAAFQPVKEVYWDPTWMPTWVLALIESGQFGEAELRLEWLKTKDPHSSNAEYLRGYCKLKEGEPEAALPFLERAIELDPFMADAWSGVGWVRFRQGRLEEALAPFQRALELKPDLAWAAEFFLRAQAQILLGKAKEHTARGWRLCGEDRIEEGLRELYHALRLVPDFPEARHYAAAVLRRQQAEFLGGADSPQALQLLASAYAVQGDYQEARNILGIALKSAQAHEDEARVKELRARLAQYERGLAFEMPAAGATP